MKFMIILLIGLFVWDIPVIGAPMRQILIILIGFGLVFKLPAIISAILKPRQIM